MYCDHFFRLIQIPPPQAVNHQWGLWEQRLLPEGYPVHCVRTRGGGPGRQRGGRGIGRGGQPAQMTIDRQTRMRVSPYMFHV